MESDRLFARLYLDEDVHVRIARIVRGHGFSVRTVRGENMLGATDAEQLAFAADQGLVIVTHNRTDFENLFGGLSMACDFADLVQNRFGTRPVAPLQDSFGPRSCTSPAVSRLNIHPPNSF